MVLSPWAHTCQRVRGFCVRAPRSACDGCARPTTAVEPSPRGCTGTPTRACCCGTFVGAMLAQLAGVILMWSLVAEWRANTLARNPQQRSVALNQVNLINKSRSKMQLRDIRGSSGRLLFERGRFPRRRALRHGPPGGPIPPGVLGDDHPQEPLPDTVMFNGWWRWRREGLNWSILEEYAQEDRVDVQRVARHGVSASFHAFVGTTTFGFQVPPEVVCDRFACHSELEAEFITVVDGYAPRMLGPLGCTMTAEFISAVSLASGRWDYTDKTPSFDVRSPPTRMSKADPGNRLRR